jgi:hypothetical protein
MSAAQQCRLLAAKARVKALAAPDESETYLAIAREYEAIAAAMEAKAEDASEDGAGEDRAAARTGGPR